MEVGLMVSAMADVDIETIGTQAESLEYDALWVGELWRESSVVQLGELAAVTDEIGLGSAILNVYSRSPAVLAMTAASLQRASNGRFTLGTGVSTRTAVEKLHGQSFDRPVRRAHETIEAIRCLTGAEPGDEPVSYTGELIAIDDVEPLERSVPIYHAGLGPANRRVVGRLCDGWIPHNIPFSHLDVAFDEVREAATERGRDAETITVAPYVPAAVSEDLEEARETLRRHVAYYVGSGEGYRRAVGTVYPEAAARIETAWQAGDRETAATAVTDEMVADLGIAARPETASDRLADLVNETVIDHPIVVLPVPASRTVAMATITGLSPANG